MSEYLVIRWLSPQSNTTSTQVQWLLVDQQGGRLGALMQGSLAEAVALAPHRQVIVVVPATDTLHFEPVLPPLKNGMKLAQVVPFALEDQLASDVDNLHFAIGKRQDRPGTPVTVVSHDAMQRWLLPLRQLSVQPVALYAESALLPARTGMLHILIESGQVTVRRELEPPLTLDLGSVAESLAHLVPVDTQVAATVYVADTDYDREQGAIEALRERVASLQVKLLPDGLLPLLALRAITQNETNLLQGPYAPRINLGNQAKPWRIAASLIAGFVAISMMTQGLKLSQLRKTEAALDEQIKMIYSGALPGTPTNPTDARRAFETRLLQIQSASSGNGLMTGLDTLASTIAQVPGLQIDALAFRNDNLDLRLVAPNVDALERLRQQAQARNLSAEIQAANPRDNKVEGRMQLRLPPGA